MKYIINTILSCLFLSCSNSNNQKITESTFKNRTFELHLEIRKDSIRKDSSIIEFKDSTYKFSRFSSDNNDWYFTNYNNSSFLVLGHSTIGVKRINDSVIDGINLSYKNVTYKFILNSPTWNKEQLYGKWVEEIYIEKPKGFFPPPALTAREETNNWPPHYIITKNEIVCDYYTLSKSKYHINDLNDFISIDLFNEIKGSEIKWKVKNVTDSTLVINRLIDKGYGNNESEYDYSEDIRLIRVE